MKKPVSRRIELLSIFCIAMVSFALFSPTVCHGQETGELDVDFSPNIINIMSERLGDVRVFTAFRYSTFLANGDSLFIYFDGCDSVENIRATRDSLGNLILRFSLEDLLDVFDACDLDSEAYYYPEVVITMTNGDAYVGKGEVYITGKQGKD